mmetsp:Transcript_36111/g.103724  ORF Transcript_36111/g.103724 Transcript_36111/m.103724 type:complete len:304 (-) Transcript_36111:25-936(-)
MLACIASTRSVHAHHHMVGLTTSGRLWYNGGYTSLPTPLLRHHMLANQTDLSYLAHTAASDSSCTIPSLHAATLQSIHKSVCPPPQATSRFLSCFILASTSSTRATFCVIVVLLSLRMASLVCCQALLSSSAISRTASLSRSIASLVLVVRSQRIDGRLHSLITRQRSNVGSQVVVVASDGVDVRLQRIDAAVGSECDAVGFDGLNVLLQGGDIRLELPGEVQNEGEDGDYCDGAAAIDGKKLVADVLVDALLQCFQLLPGIGGIDGQRRHIGHRCSLRCGRGTRLDVGIRTGHTASSSRAFA